MNKLKRFWSPLTAFGILLLLILDTETASEGTKEGISLCLNVIIPSLFPFFFVTAYLNQALLGIHIPGLRLLAKKMQLPSGAENILLLGFLGGYPVGAQAVSDACRRDKMDWSTGRILLGYCSNAGPAFIFGVTRVLFSSKWVPWSIWCIHIVSAMIVGYLLPKPNCGTILLQNDHEPSVMQAFQQSLHTTMSVCGWIVVFRILIAFLSNFLSSFNIPSYINCLIGFLELSNGCLLLSCIQHESVRFVLCTVFLAFSGLCVIMQTSAVLSPMGLGLYLPGKILQTLISMLITIPVALLTFDEFPIPIHWIVLIYIASVAILIAVLFVTKNNCGKKILHSV